MIINKQKLFYFGMLISIFGIIPTMYTNGTNLYYTIPVIIGGIIMVVGYLHDHKTHNGRD